MHRMLVVAVVVASGCAGTNTPAPLSSNPQAQGGMKFTNTAFGTTHSSSSKHLDLPFQLKADGVNGTALLLGFLQKAETGAAYISDVSYSVQLVYKGMPVECVSKIVVEDGSAPPAAAPAPFQPPDDADYSTDVAPWRPGMSDSWVVDRDMHCVPHGVSKKHVVVKHPVEYAAEVKRNLNPEAWCIKQDWDRLEGTTEVTNEPEYTDECSFNPNKHFVHRYDHFLAAKLMPPDLDLIRKLYSNFRLIESPPECHRIERIADAPLRQHITANVYYSGAVVLEEPHGKDILTSRPMIRGRSH